MFALVRDRSQSPSLSRAYFANNCVKSPFVDAHVRSSKLRLSTGALSRTSSEHCLSAVRRTGVNEFVTPVTQTVAYIGYAPVCGGGAFAYSMRIFPRHDAVSACGRNEGRTGSPSFFGVARQICVLRKYALPKNGDFLRHSSEFPNIVGRAASARARTRRKYDDGAVFRGVSAASVPRGFGRSVNRTDGAFPRRAMQATGV